MHNPLIHLERALLQMHVGLPEPFLGSKRLRFKTFHHHSASGMLKEVSIKFAAEKKKMCKVAITGSKEYQDKEDRLLGLKRLYQFIEQALKRSRTSHEHVDMAKDCSCLQSLGQGRAQGTMSLNSEG